MTGGLKDGSWQEWQMFDATLPGTGQNGEHMIEFTPVVVVTGIKFKAPGKINGQDHEFALMGLDIEPAGIPQGVDPPTSAVPEPSAGLLFSLGGLADTSAVRRRRV